MLKLIILLICIFTFSGCATIETTKVNDPDSEVKGVRVNVPPKTYFLFVDTAANQTTIIGFPTLGNIYDIKPNTMFGKQDFTLKLGDNGELTELLANQDTTGILSFFEGMAKVGADLAKAAGKAAAPPALRNLEIQTIGGTFGLPGGYYRYTKEGFVKQPTP